MSHLVYIWETGPCTHCVGDRVGHAGMGTVVIDKENAFRLSQMESQFFDFQLVA